MKLHEIIKSNSVKTTAIEWGQIAPYLKSLNTFYKDLFCCDPIVMVVSVSNAAQYVKIVPCDEFNACVCDYIGCEEHEIENSDDLLAQFETINFNSKFLKQLIN